jgi:hypothetical protein
MSQIAARAADPAPRIKDPRPFYEAKWFRLPLCRIERADVHLIDQVQLATWDPLLARCSSPTPMARPLPALSEGGHRSRARGLEPMPRQAVPENRSYRRKSSSFNILR